MSSNERKLTYEFGVNYNPKIGRIEWHVPYNSWNDEYDLSIEAIEGSVIYKENDITNNGIIVLSANDLQSGTYFINICYDEKSFKEKVIVLK